MPSDGDTFHIKVSADGTTANTATFTGKIVLGTGATLSDYASVIPFLQAAIRAAPAAPVSPPPLSPQLAATLAPLLTGATVQLVGSASTAHFRVLAGRGGPGFNPLASMTFDTFTGSQNDMGLGTAPANAQQYSLGLSDALPPATSIGAQKALASKGGIGADGGLPGANQLIGDPLHKTGLHALDDVDLFNILCIPRAVALDTGPPWTNFQAVTSAARAYCRQRRAFLAVDIPPVVAGVQAMQTWMAEHTLRDNNAAVYFPRIMVPDPLNQNRLRNVGRVERSLVSMRRPT